MPYSLIPVCMSGFLDTAVTVFPASLYYVGIDVSYNMLISEPYKNYLPAASLLL